ncbi:hypothetical protein CBS101457_001998 [Exobasidium rhododendri]|nr:hypothetical protein CBS101457_001998 [Exobasidium rhododendri]
MYNGGGGSRQNWQNANNPNMAPLPIRPRPGVGAPQMPQGMQGGMPPGPGMMLGGPSPQMGATMGGPPMMNDMLAGPTPTSAGGVPAHTTLFVGNISAGVTDPWLHSLLNSCGPLRSFKRVNASFGFAEYADPDSVLRALAVLSGQELPALGAVYQESADATKKLTVKADAKTRKFLDQYEQEKQKTEHDDHAERQARDGVDTVMTQMLLSANTESTETVASYNVPSHLKDLPPEELPEEHRGSVLSEIEKFRQASAAREDEKKRKEKIQDLERVRANRDHNRGGLTGPASNGRALGGEQDRQSYLRPVGFVGSSDAEEEKNLRMDQKDEKEEERRQQREQDDLNRTALDAERRFLGLERSRLTHWERELGREKAEEEDRERESVVRKRIYDGWDQKREAERQYFYTDRQRWRLTRKAARDREEREDEQDRQAQAEEEKRAKSEAEKFLAQQAEDMAAFEAKQRAAGVLIPGEGSHAPLKLKVAPTAVHGSEESARQVQVGVLGNAEDDSDLTGLRRGKLARIDLNDEATDASNREERKRKIREDLPADATSVFDREPKWEHLRESDIEESYKALLDKGIVESIGESVPDMVEELVSKIRAHHSAKDLISVVEEVLEEEAVPLIERLWRELLINTWSV